MSLVIAPLVVWLSSTESRGITGRLFGISGGQTVAEGWHAGPRIEHEGRWHSAKLGKVVPDLIARAAPNAEVCSEIPAREAVRGV